MYIETLGSRLGRSAKVFKGAKAPTTYKNTLTEPRTSTTLSVLVLFLARGGKCCVHTLYLTASYLDLPNGNNDHLLFGSSRGIRLKLLAPFGKAYNM